MESIITAVFIAAIFVGLLEVYRAHKNHATFKTEATNDLAYLKSRIAYLEQSTFRAYAVASSGNTTPPPVA